MKKHWTTVTDFILHGKVSSKYSIIDVAGINQVGDGGALTLVRTGNVGTPNQSFINTGNNTCTDDNGDEWEVQKGTILNYNGTDNWFGGSFGSEGVGTYILNDSNSWVVFLDEQDIPDKSSFTLRFDSIANMLAGIPVRSEPGDVCIVLDTTFKHESGSGFVITDFTPLSERGSRAYQANNMEELRNAVGDLNDTPVRAYGSRHLINNPASTHAIVDVANFAGQNLGEEAPIGFIHHHYTDGTMHQFDNVGEANNILVLKNAQNETRRPDKPSDFVGSGNFLSLRYVDPAVGFTKTGFFIDKDMKQVWTGEKGTAVLWQNRADDGTSAFRLQTTHKHDVILDIMNGLTQSRILQLLNDVSGERFLINSLSELQNGVGFQADKGDVWLLSLEGATGRIKVSHPIQASDAAKNTQLTAPANKVVEVLTPFKPRQYSTAQLPDASTFDGCLISISDLTGKPSPLVYSDGTNWRYMDNTLV